MANRQVQTDIVLSLRTNQCPQRVYYGTLNVQSLSTVTQLRHVPTTMSSASVLLAVTLTHSSTPEG